MTRPISPGLEPLLDRSFPVLDHGFVRVVDYMGNDEAVVQAARVSYGKGTDTPAKDKALIDYLMRNRHSSPFEMNEIKLHVKLPIFVARQWIRHRTANANEFSMRYSEAPKEVYMPKPEHLARQSTDNKQGRGDVLTPAEARQFLSDLGCDVKEAQDTYTFARDTLGLSRELARIGLPLNTYTEWYWKTDLHNLFHFLSLRADKHAQYEIRVYAEQILDLVEAWVPWCHAAFVEHRLGAATFSKSMITALRELLSTPQRVELLVSHPNLTARDAKALREALS